MKELHEDQINADEFQKLSDFIWSPNKDCSYVNSVIDKYNQLKIFNPEIPLDKSKGVIFIGQCQLIETCFESIPNEGNYIVIHRTNDRSFTEDMYKKKPASVKHIYTVDCAVNKPDVTAIPIGLATIGGEDKTIGKIVKEDNFDNYLRYNIDKTKIFCRFNTNPQTPERLEWVEKLNKTSFSKVITAQINEEDFYRNIKAHKYTMSLQGMGKDACRTWSAMILGSIPIVTDCVEMRHFEDMPIVYCPEVITVLWLNSQDLRSKSLKRTRMSYWVNEIYKKVQEL